MGHVEIEFPIYQRLFVLLKLKPDEERIRELMATHGLDPKQARALFKSAFRTSAAGVASSTTRARSRNAAGKRLNSAKRRRPVAAESFSGKIAKKPA